MYSVIAYRWGHPENYSYIVGIFDDYDLAKTAAKQEQADRGGNQYFCEIREHKINKHGRGEAVWGDVHSWKDDSVCEYCGHPIEKGDPA